MSCTTCNCNKKTASQGQHTPANPWVQLFKAIPQGLWLIIAIALSAAVYTRYAQVAPNQCTTLEPRVSQLERHAVRVDSQFHKSLK